MSLHVYRVCRAIYARLDGQGARLVGGRWNSPGHAVVYMADSIALAVLENLVHMPRQDFPTGYVTVAAEIPAGIELLEASEVQATAGIETATEQNIGDYWIARGLSAVLRVPSAVLRGGSNYLLNPAHLDHQRIVVARPVPFEFDPRLFG